jgi:hypothetical protein
MADNDRERGDLRLVPGGRPDRLRLGPVEITVAPEDRPPFPVDARVIEDDTYAVLGADPEFHPTAEHPVRLWTELKGLEPTPPGSVIVKGDRPLRMMAVVHDLSLDPTWRETWVSEALEEVLREVGRRDLHSLALPPLGGVHGRLPAAVFVALLRGTAERVGPTRLERLWLVAPPGREEDLLRALQGEPD